MFFEETNIMVLKTFFVFKSSYVLSLSITWETEFIP